ncbi:MAG: outer membrane beta-barrel protein [Beijerinckiaceae bacterium]
MGVLSGTGILPGARTKGVELREELGAFFRAKAAPLRLPLLAALVSIAALQCGPSYAADDPPCAANGITPPCQFFPPGPSAADHSGNHDKEFFWILFNAYADEWHRMPPDDPNAPPTRSARVATAPVSAPPFPFVDWPTGTTQIIGATTPNSVDSPLMKALIGGTPFGKPMEDAHVQVYGWVDFGMNYSNARGFEGNAPAAYANTPNTLSLDQAVVYIERVPDEVQKDHLDWGFRLAPIYGENYRYTTALGFFSNQLVYQNHWNGFDVPMAYGEVYVPWIAEGVNIRLGRYISIPDIEAQLAPNNYMYTHSLAYATDNYTNTGLATSVKLTKNWLVQFALSAGTETFPWNAKTTTIPGYTGPRDPGTQPTITACIQYETDTAADHIYLCVDGLNNGEWGYNNLQWQGGTYYHKFNEVFHVSFEAYYEYERGVWNKAYTGPGYANNATGNPYFGTPWLGMLNPANEAICPANQPTCRAGEYAALAYWVYRIGTFDDLSLRTEFYNDMQGQRFGYVTKYVGVGLGWQHWFGPQIEVRPELTYYHSLDAPAFSNGTQHDLVFLGGDMIWHF